MARVRLLKPYNLKQSGDVIEVTGGIASVLILQKTAELYREPVEGEQDQEAHAVNDATNGQRLVEKTITRTVGDVSISTTEKFDTANRVSLGTVTVAVTDLPEYQALLAQLATAREASDALRWALEASETRLVTTEARLLLKEEMLKLWEEDIASLQEQLEQALTKGEKTDLPSDAEATHPGFKLLPYGPGQAAWEEYQASQAIRSEPNAEGDPDASVATDDTDTPSADATKPKSARGNKKVKAETAEVPASTATSEQSPVDETASSVVSGA